MKHIPKITSEKKYQRCRLALSPSSVVSPSTSGEEVGIGSIAVPIGVVGGVVDGISSNMVGFQSILWYCRV